MLAATFCAVGGMLVEIIGIRLGWELLIGVSFVGLIPAIIGAKLNDWGFENKFTSFLLFGGCIFTFGGIAAALFGGGVEYISGITFPGSHTGIIFILAGGITGAICGALFASENF